MQKAISLPFSIDPFGKVTYTSDQKKIWADRVRSTIGTTVGERVMRPNFGSKIALSVFNNRDEVVNEVTENVSEVFNVQLPLLTLERVDVTVDDSTGLLSADITYKLPDERLSSTIVGLIYIKGNRPAVKENV